MKKSLVYIFVMAMVSMTLGNVSAANNKKGIDLGINIFGTTFNDTYFLAQMENSIGFGIMADYNITDNFAAGIEYNVHNHDALTDAIPAGLNTNDKADIKMFGINSKIYSNSFNIGKLNLRAYGVFGLAHYAAKLDFSTIMGAPAKYEDNSLGLNYGLGLSADIYKNFFLNFEIRKHLVKQMAEANAMPAAINPDHTNIGITAGYRF